MTQNRSSDQKHCFSCANLLHISAIHCNNCGAQQPSTSLIAKSDEHLEGSSVPIPINHQVFCRGCGSLIHESASNCPKCGAIQKISNVTTYSEGRSRIVAVVLAFLLGGIGGHKFYLGQVGMGILYLIFCWTFIPTIIAFIEGIIFLSMSDNDFTHKYN